MKKILNFAKTLVYEREEFEECMYSNVCTPMYISKYFIILLYQWPCLFYLYS